MTRFGALALSAIMLPCLPAFAEPVTGEVAAKLVFPVTEMSAVEMTGKGGLSETDAKTLQLVGAGQPFYGAIAISPDEGIMVEATVAAVNHHSTEAAEAAALKGCEDKRKGKAACAVVALIRPEGWEARALSLSADATRALGADYKAPGAMAVSPATGLFGMAKGDQAGDTAIKACEEKAKTGDCVLVIQD